MGSRPPTEQTVPSKTLAEPWTSEGPPLSRGQLVGRYVIIDHLGSGGMGVVFAAYDPELDRKVAIKLLHPEVATAPDEARGGRQLLREAQALARLSHPNVLTVHDVAEHQQQVFLAMEFVEGANLGVWLHARDRNWRDVLEMFVHAGRGLAAAHARDLVHRDFKPANVMIGNDGRVRVMDFGLARALVTESPEPDSTLEDMKVAPTEDALRAGLTHAGSAVGTPAYMAPEQHLALPTDARTDQFSFCVALYEALYKERPFAGDTLPSLALEVTRGKVRPASVGTQVPSWVRNVVVRGLASEPDERYPTMNALLEALHSDPTRKRRWWGAIALTGLLGAGAYGAVEIAHERRVSQCSELGMAIQEVWNDAAAARLHEGLAASSAAYAATTYDKLVPWLDDYAAAWRAARTRDCVASEVDGTRRADLHARAVECLDERATALASLVTVLSEGEATAALRAVSAAAGLPPLADCMDEASLIRRTPLSSDAGQRAIEVELRNRLRTSATLRSAARYPESLAVAKEVLADLEAHHVPRLRARVLYHLGALEEDIGEYQTAERDLTEAFLAAGAVGDDRTVVEAAGSLTYVIGARQRRPEEGLLWGRIADMALTRLDERDQLLHSGLSIGLGLVHDARGAYREALEHHKHALTIRERLLGPEHPGIAAPLDNIGMAFQALGLYEEALLHHDRALAITTRSFGSDHPAIATSLGLIGYVHLDRGAYDEARTAFERALVIRRAALGPSHNLVASAISNLAMVERAVGNYEEALELFEQTLTLTREALGHDNPEVGNALNNVGVLYDDLGRHDEAASHYEQALALKQSALGPDHPQVGATLDNLGVVHLARGAHEQALACHTRALGILVAKLGPEHEKVADALNNLANVHYAMGANTEALAHHLRALAIRERALGASHPDVAMSLNNLGDVHRALGAPDLALALHERALAIIEATFGPEHSRTASTLLGVAEAELVLGHAAAAVKAARRVVAITKAAGSSARARGQARFVLARALWSARADREQARELARLAHADFEEDGPGSAPEAAQAAAWLRRPR